VPSAGKLIQGAALYSSLCSQVQAEALVFDQGGSVVPLQVMATSCCSYGDSFCYASLVIRAPELKATLCDNAVYRHAPTCTPASTWRWTLTCA
jgi:hypothetical protein